ncbi:YjjG family noncanonical pyrimidine nucleotidase [Intestinibacillus massiliensis]|uniref:YjjG family noncanonical pyrimidine nucleotidase n=1 Tax=Intestinibacillus massiliensis TaxID=1871029 RepID=UPI000B356AA1|nr:YjjG family noncanonical pyrimidine nucleotidase [Intestinibacillus massiliensis]
MERKMTVFLDLDGTVLDFAQSERHAFFTAMARLGIPADEGDFARYHEINQSMWAAIERGEATGEEIRPLRFQRLLEARGHWDWDRVNAHYIAALAEAGIPYPGAVPFVGALHREHKVCVVTNGLRRSQQSRLEHAGLAPYTDLMLTSEEVGAPKPAPDMFFEAMARFGDDNPAHYIMFGDSLTADIVGAQAAGVRAVWFNPSGKAPSCGVRPDWTVGDYQGAAQILLDSRSWEL